MKTADHALSDREYETLLDTLDGLEGDKKLQTRFILLVSSRLGMRAGEINHMQKEWVNFHRRIIDIPYHEDCDVKLVLLLVN